MQPHDFVSSNTILPRLAPLYSPARTCYLLSAPATRTLFIIDPEDGQENSQAVQEQMRLHSLDRVRVLHLNSPKNAEKQFLFEEEGPLGLCRIQIGEIPRGNFPAQNLMLAITDTSPNSDKMTVLFTGDLLNFWHAAKLSDADLGHFVEAVPFLFRGFFDHQFVFGCESDAEARLNLEFFRIAGGNADLASAKEAKGIFRLFNLAEHRVLNPLFFLDPPRFGHLTPGKPPFGSKVALLRFLAKMRGLMA